MSNSTYIEDDDSYMQKVEERRKEIKRQESERQKKRIKTAIIAEMEDFIYHRLNCAGDIQCNNVEALIADMKRRIELLTISE